MPSLTVYQPPNNLAVHLNQPFLVTGQASDRGPPEPALIDSVTVQVDNGPIIKAALTHIPNKTITLYSFKAFAQVTGGQDPHTVTVTATTGARRSALNFASRARPRVAPVATHPSRCPSSHRCSAKSVHTQAAAPAMSV